MIKYYKLEGKEVVPGDDLMEWGQWFEQAKRSLASTVVAPGIRVSTCFLGIDHNFGRTGPPLVFETMIFGGEHDQYTERYSTWDDAINGHYEAVMLATMPADEGVKSDE